MAIASFKAGLKANLPTTFVDGAIYITTDTGELYFGNENSGVKISDFVAVATYEDLPAAPLANKFYYVTGDSIIYKYQGGQWVPISGGGGGSVTAGTGLTKSGSTIKAKLLSESNLTNDAINPTEVAGRVYAVVPDKTGRLAVNVPWSNTTYESKNAVSGGSDVSLVTTGEKYTWNSKTSNTGTVTSISTTDGLTGGPVSTSGTLKANLRSFTKLTNDSAAATETSGRIYPVALDKTGYLAVNVPWQNTTYSSKTATSGGTELSLVTTGEKYLWNSKGSGSGSVTQVATSAGLTGGPITTSGTIGLDLKSTTKSSLAASDMGSTANRQYAVGLDSNGKLSVNIPWENTTYSNQSAASGGTTLSLVTTGEKYTWNNKSTLSIGTTASTAAAGNHTHSTSIATSTGTSQITLNASAKYAITAGGTSYIFTTPPNTTYESKAAASGGTDVSLVTTGEKYTWNNKSSLSIGTTATTAAAGNHTHTTTIAADSGTSQLTMSANTKYKLTAGGSSYIFTTPSTLSIGTTASTAAAGNHTHSTSIATSSGTNQLTLAASTKYAITAGGSSYIFTTPPNTTYESKAAASGGTDVSLVTTGDKYNWNNKSSLTIGTTATTAAAGNHTHSTSIATSTGTSQLTMSANTKYAITAGGSSYIFTTPSTLSIGTTSSTAAAGNHTHSTSIATSSGTNQLTMAASTKYAITAGGSSYIFTTPPNTTYSGGTGISISGTTINCTVAGGTWSATASGAAGAISVSITNPKNSTSVTVDPYCENTAGTNGGTAPVAINEVKVTASTITLYFNALAAATTFKCLVYSNQ